MKTLTLILLAVLAFPVAADPVGQQTCVEVKAASGTVSLGHFWVDDLDEARANAKASDLSLKVKNPAVCERKIGHPTP